MLHTPGVWIPGMWSPGAFQAEPTRARLAGSQQGSASVSPRLRELSLCHVGRKLSRSRNTAKYWMYRWKLEIWNQRQLSEEIKACPVPLLDRFDKGELRSKLRHGWRMPGMGLLNESESGWGGGILAVHPRVSEAYLLFDPNTLAPILVICEDNKSQALGEVEMSKKIWPSSPWQESQISCRIFLPFISPLDLSSQMNAFHVSLSLKGNIV